MRIPGIPRSWTLGEPERLARFLLPLFSDETEIKTIKWILGNASVDLGSRSEFLLLYSPGGIGKSNIICAIEKTTRGCSSTIGSGVLPDTRQGMHVDTAKPRYPWSTQPRHSGN